MTPFFDPIKAKNPALAREVLQSTQTKGKGFLSDEKEHCTGYKPSQEKRS